MPSIRSAAIEQATSDMEIVFTRAFRGPLGLAVLDLAGTVVDFGSRAPTGAFIELFARHGLRVSESDVRGPMGMHKRDHIAALCALPAVADQWRAKYGRPVAAADIDELYQEFIPIQIQALERHANPIPGAAETLAALRSRGLRIAFTTGYSREMTDIVLVEAAKSGIKADVVVCATEVPAGRPAPWMALECARRLQVYPPAAVVKFGDTVVDIEEGRNAGMWSVGAAISGSLVGLAREAWESLPEHERRKLRSDAARTLYSAGAHAVADTLRDLPSWVDRINAVLREGGAPDHNPEDRPQNDHAFLSTTTHA